MPKTLLNRIAKTIQQECINRNASGFVICEGDDGIIFETGWLDSELLEESLQKEFNLNRELPPNPKELSKREKEILSEYVNGLWPKEIALKLSISGKTVDHHLCSVKKKLGIDHPIDLIKYGMQKGILKKEM